MNEGKSYKIGKSRSCDIVLADDTVSSRHAEIVIHPGGKIFLTDMGSRNGSYILKGHDFKKIRQTYITPTDIVKFGLCEIAVKDLLEFLHLRTIPLDHESPKKEKQKVEGKQIVRCIYCGSPKKAGESCKVCDQETRSC